MGSFYGQNTQTEIETTLKGEGGTVLCMPAQDQTKPDVGQVVTQRINWNLRYCHMRMHTALHLLSVAIPVTRDGWSDYRDKRPAGL